MGFIFRGGDIWHFGNSGATPYTGGTWTWTWKGTMANCDVTDSGGSQTGCIYIGVDPNWHSGSSWARPILTGDNPTCATVACTQPAVNTGGNTYESTAYCPNCGGVTSCAYPEVGSENYFFTITAYAVILDNFEFTGLCQQYSSSNTSEESHNRYVVENIVSGSQIAANVYRNLYIHGWTHLPFDTTGDPPTGLSYAIGGFWTGGSDNSTLEGSVVDGSDSDPMAGAAIIAGGPGYLVFHNVFSYFSDVAMGGCHVWHDNLWINYYPTGDGEAHGNSFECITDYPATNSAGQSQGSGTINAFYNNVFSHNAANNATAGDVKALFHLEPGVSEYQFNNVMYDQGTANYWDYGTSDAGTGTMAYLFNNTFDEPGTGAINCVQWETAVGNHVITESGNGFASGSCTITSDVVMSHATAVAQGYMASGTGQTGNSGGVSCANDTTPCGPTASGDSTVGAGVNEYSGYCATMLASSDPLIVQAGHACQSATTDACSYNTTNHTVTCPGEAAVARPSSGAWDAGAYQYAQQTVQPPTNLTATPH
jgi:hypothetical protein